MATYSKLPSGKWRAVVYVGKDKDGKQIRKSITRDTKKEAENAAKALELSSNKTVQDINIKTAIQNYIDNSENTLSPSTIAGYRQASRIRYSLIDHIKISEFNSIHARGLIDAWVKEGLSPKTIRNSYNLLHAALKMYIPNISLNITLPKKKIEAEYIPTDEDIKKLLAAAKGTSAEIPIKLAAFCSLRRGEIAALTKDDIKDGYIYISKSLVRADNGEHLTKSPKTTAGYRKVKPPKELLAELEALPDGAITNLTPNGIYKAFSSALARADLPHFRFHALRHYFASSLHFAGIPDKYIMQMGGWDSMEVLTRIYQHTLKDKEEALMNNAADYFDKLGGKGE